MKVPGRLVRGRIRPDRWSAVRFASLRWAALPVIDRRWTAPMSAIALGFGLFVGVAIGPGTQGSLGTTRPMLVQLPAESDGTTTTADASPRGGQEPQLPPASNLGHKPKPSPFTPPASSTPPPVSSPPSYTPPPTTSPSYTPPAYTPPVQTETTTTTTDTTTDEQTTTDETTTTELAGTVIHLNAKAGSYTIASDGQLIAIHTGNPPDIGQAVEVEATQLANGTYGEDGNRTRTGTRGQVTLGGTVSFSDSATGAYTVSAPGVSLLIRGGAQRKPPKLGDSVEISARIADHPTPLPVSPAGREGCEKPPALPKPPRVAIEQVGASTAQAEDTAADEDTTDEDTTTDEQGVSANGSAADVEGVLQGVCRHGSRTLIVGADDVRESGKDIAVNVPSKFALGSLEPGQVVKLAVSIGSAGNYTLTGIASDERREGADDANRIQP